MITNETIINLKGCNAKERAKVKDILLKNYMLLLNEIEKEADYCTVDSYWKGLPPISKPIIEAKTLFTIVKRHIIKRGKT